MKNNLTESEYKKNDWDLIDRLAVVLSFQFYNGYYLPKTSVEERNAMNLGFTVGANMPPSILDIAVKTILPFYGADPSLYIMKDWEKSKVPNGKDILDNSLACKLLTAVMFYDPSVRFDTAGIYRKEGLLGHLIGRKNYISLSDIWGFCERYQREKISEIEDKSIIEIITRNIDKTFDSIYTALQLVLEGHKGYKNNDELNKDYINYCIEYDISELMKLKNSPPEKIKEFIVSSLQINEESLKNIVGNFNGTDVDLEKVSDYMRNKVGPVGLLLYGYLDVFPDSR